MHTSRIHLSGKEKLTLFTDLATMLTAGIPILEIVESLEADSRGSLRSVLRELKHSLTNGEPLSRGMEHFPRTFDAVTINTMRAAEAGGTLEETLADLVKTLKKDLAFSDSIRVAMIYPAFVGVIFTGIILLMLTFVIPRISQVFSAMHVEMPLITKIMIASSNYYIANWPMVSAAFVGTIVLFYLFIAANRRTVVRILLSLPGLKELGLNIDLSRMTRSFALLLRSGVPLDEALILSKRVVLKPEVLAAIVQMQRNIEAGRPLGDHLRETHSAIPSIMARSIQTAETAGTLEQTLQSLAEYFDDQVAESLKIVGSLLEPLMIIVIGIMVGGLMVTIIAPIYNLISQVNATH